MDAVMRIASSCGACTLDVAAHAVHAAHAPDADTRVACAAYRPIGATRALPSVRTAAVARAARSAHATALVALVVLVALAVLGCTTEQAVLGIETVRGCDAVWLAPPGTACSFAGTCNRPATANPQCCSDTAYCANGMLVVDHACNPDCAVCVTDHECTYGAALCTNGHCTPCPPPVACAPCPQGWGYLARNGCSTCECAPPSQCMANVVTPPNTPPPPMCPPPEQCYPGKRCAAGCAPGDDCCANTCAAPGCQAPAPVGCFMPCGNIPCNQCAADACECGPNGWICTPRCMDGMPVSLSCSV